VQQAELLKKIKRIEIVSTRLVENALSGNYLSTFHGTGLEFSEVREYFPGDEVRFIDWNVTARSGRPFIKVFREERELTLILAVDVSRSLDFGTQGGSKRELAAQVAAALGFAAVQNQDRVGFLLFSDQVESFLPPKRGKRHLLRGVRDILAMEPKGQGSALGPAMQRLGSMARRGAAVFVISDFLMPGVEEALRAPSLRYDVIAARVRDQAEESLPRFAGLLPARDPESGRRFWVDTDSFFGRRRFESRRRARLNEVLRSFKKLRIDMFEARGEGDFSKDLMKFFKKRERRVRR
jgi:uncharacterized protein (DUF58 family)